MQTENAGSLASFVFQMAGERLRGGRVPLCLAVKRDTAIALQPLLPSLLHPHTQIWCLCRAGAGELQRIGVYAQRTLEPSWIAVGLCPLLLLSVAHLSLGLIVCHEARSFCLFAAASFST